MNDPRTEGASRQLAAMPNAEIAKRAQAATSAAEEAALAKEIARRRETSMTSAYLAIGLARGERPL
jgi:uncharacterized protein YqeY